MTPGQRTRALQEIAVWAFGFGTIICAFYWGIK